MLSYDRGQRRPHQDDLRLRERRRRSTVGAAFRIGRDPRASEEGRIRSLAAPLPVVDAEAPPRTGCAAS